VSIIKTTTVFSNKSSRCIKEKTIIELYFLYLLQYKLKCYLIVENINVQSKLMLQS